MSSSPSPTTPMYGQIGGRSDAEERQTATLWMLNQSDGRMSLLDVAERSGVPLALLAEPTP
jgi:aminopeptidase-like protein